MKQPLPLDLRIVKDGRLTMRQAHEIWAFAVYGVTPSDDAATQQEALSNCRRDLPPLLMFSGPLNDPDNAWMLFSAFMGVAAANNVDIGVDFIHTTAEELEERFRQGCNAPTVTPPPRSRQDDEQLPGNGRKDRRQELVRIIAALKECDPNLHETDMPCTRPDFLAFCSELNRHLFSIQQDSFNDVIKGWLGFRSGARSTTYYNELLPKIRGKLG